MQTPNVSRNRRPSGVFFYVIMVSNSCWAKEMRAVVISFAIAATTLTPWAEAAKPAYSPAQIHEIFFLLGMNGEYLGKPAGEMDFFPLSQRAAEAVFEDHAERLRIALNLKSATNVWAIVDSFYKKTGEYGGNVVYFISEEAFDGYGENAELGYLAGATVRHWHDGSLWIPNGVSKAEVIGELLVRHDCRDVWACRDFGRPPTGVEVRFKPSKAIQKLIDDAVAEREKKAPQELTKPNHPVEPTRAPAGARGSP